MGKIKKILENELVGGTQSTDIYPVTSVKAVYDEDNEALDGIIKRKGVVNISTNYNKDHTAEVLTLKQAIAKIPSKDRVLGFQGKYLATDGWHTIIYTGDNITSWSDTTKWIDLPDKILRSISKNATFGGIATPTTNPGTPDGPVFYLATEAGTYANFNGISVANGEVAILEWKDSWTKKTTGLVAEQEIIYDVSARNGGEVFESLQSLLSSSNLSTLIPTSVRHGGMSIRFIQGSKSSVHKYVQYRLMNQNWSTTASDWQGVDDVPTPNSNNLVKSGGVIKSIKIIKVLQESEENGYYIVDNDGNIVIQYNSNGFDVALLSEHIKNLIKNINGIGFPDDVRLMLLNTIISSISENSWNLIDNNYNIAAKYDILGFDVAKINKHFKRLIDSVGFAEIAKLYSSDNPYGVNYTKYYISGRERFIDENNIIPLFIVAGQSNAVGAETQDHSPEWLVRGKLENYNMWNPQQHAFSTYNIVGNNGGTSGNFGFDIYFAKKWLDTYGTPIYACKVANGGTAIGYKQGVSHCWNADIDMLKENNCISLCEVFINRIQDIFEWGIQNNKIIVPIAILWLQGETDAVYGFQNDYQTNLSAVFSLLRGCLGSNTIPIINAPIEKKSESARATINAAYTAMNNLDKNFFTINTDDFVDGTHYNYRIFDYHFLAEGYKEIGERMFTIYKNNFNL